MAQVPSLRDSYPFTTLTQHSATPTSAKPALVGDPGHVLGYDCVALRASMAQSQVSASHPTSPLRVTSGYMVFGWGISHLPTKIPALGQKPGAPGSPFCWANLGSVHSAPGKSR